MSKYTTGEIAKLCGVTVRTVQYYDTRGILVPNELTDGGRRLYSEDDVRRLKIICFLRELGLSIDTISRLLAEENPGSVISILLEQQEQVLKDEMQERRTKLDKLENLKQELEKAEHLSIDTIGDIAFNMENKKKLHKTRMTMAFSSIAIAVIQWTAVVIGYLKGIWWPYLILIFQVIGIPFAIWLSRYYFSHIFYICPECHQVFRPSFKEALFARHTTTTRKLTCTNCGHHGFCVETAADTEEKADA